MTNSTEQPARAPAGRITVEESFLDLIDQLATGDLATWRRVYAAALADPAARQAVVRAAGMVDSDFASAGRLWQTLVERMPPLRSADPAAPLPHARTPVPSATAGTRR